MGQLNAGPGLPTANAPRTVEAWVKTTSSGPIVMYGSGATVNLFDLSVRANAVGLVTYNNDHWFTTPYAVANGAWHQVVVTYDGAGVVTMYLDGTSLGTQSVGGTLNTIPDANGLLIGNDYWGSLSGSVDEVAVYPKALTAAQVLAHFSASGNTRPTAPTAVLASSTVGNQASVSWTAATASAGAPVTTYIVTAFAGTQAQTSIGVSGTSTRATVTRLQGGTLYTFQVMAMNNFGNGPWSAASAGVTPTGTATTYASTVQADGPSIYYRLDESTGTVAADSSGNGRPAGYRGSYTLGAAGPLVNDADPGINLAGGAIGALHPGPRLPTAHRPRT